MSVLKTINGFIEKANNMIKFLTFVAGIVALYFGLKMENQVIRDKIELIVQNYEKDKELQAFKLATYVTSFEELKKRVEQNTEKIALLSQKVYFLKPDETEVKNGRR